MRNLKLVVVIAGVVTGLLFVPAQPALAVQTCNAGDCTPASDIGGWDTTGRNSILIHIDGTVKNNATALGRAHTARDRWNDCPQRAAGEMPRLVLNELDASGDVDLILDWPPRAEAARPGGDGVFVAPESGFPRWTIYIKPGKESDPNLFDHEFGHVLDLPSFAPECRDSVMNLGHPGTNGPLDCDCHNADLFNETGSEQREEEEDPTRPSSPLILDINRDHHIPTTNVDSDPPVLFDLNADGVREIVGWLAEPSEDAFLWIDRDRNGQVRDGSELFGTATLLPSGNLAENGWEALASYDSVGRGGNEDGRISPADEVWTALRLWFDVDRNGVSGAGEVSTLGDFDIIALGLRHARNEQVDQEGNLHVFRGMYWAQRSGADAGIRPSLMEDIFFQTRIP